MAMETIFEQIENDWIAHDQCEFRVLLVYRFGNWRMTIKSKVLRVLFLSDSYGEEYFY